MAPGWDVNCGRVAVYKSREGCCVERVSARLFATLSIGSFFSRFSVSATKMGCFSTHATGTLDPPEVRNWRIHLIALIASMSALASMC